MAFETALCESARAGGGVPGDQAELRFHVGDHSAVPDKLFLQRFPFRIQQLRRLEAESDIVRTFAQQSIDFARNNRATLFAEPRQYTLKHASFQGRLVVFMSGPDGVWRDLRNSLKGFCKLLRDKANDFGKLVRGKKIDFGKQDGYVGRELVEFFQQLDILVRDRRARSEERRVGKECRSR